MPQEKTKKIEYSKYIDSYLKSEAYLAEFAAKGYISTWARDRLKSLPKKAGQKDYDAALMEFKLALENLDQGGFTIAQNINSLQNITVSSPVQKFVHHYGGRTLEYVSKDLENHTKIGRLSVSQSKELLGLLNLVAVKNANNESVVYFNPFASYASISKTEKIKNAIKTALKDFDDWAANLKRYEKVNQYIEKLVEFIGYYQDIPESSPLKKPVRDFLNRKKVGNFLAAEDTEETYDDIAQHGPFKRATATTQKTEALIKKLNEDFYKVVDDLVKKTKPKIKQATAEQQGTVTRKSRWRGNRSGSQGDTSFEMAFARYLVDMQLVDVDSNRLRTAYVEFEKTPQLIEKYSKPLSVHPALGETKSDSNSMTPKSELTVTRNNNTAVEDKSAGTKRVRFSDPLVAADTSERKPSKWQPKAKPSKSILKNGRKPTPAAPGGSETGHRKQTSRELAKHAKEVVDGMRRGSLSDSSEAKMSFRELNDGVPAPNPKQPRRRPKPTSPKSNPKPPKRPKPKTPKPKPPKQVRPSSPSPKSRRRKNLSPKMQELHKKFGGRF